MKIYNEGGVIVQWQGVQSGGQNTQTVNTK